MILQIARYTAMQLHERNKNVGAGRPRVLSIVRFWFCGFSVYLLILGWIFCDYLYMYITAKLIFISTMKIVITAIFS